jgi:hypothetical protein
MSSAKLAVVSSLAAVALGGCGSIHVKPASSSGSSKLVSRGKVDDPRTTKNNHLQCLRQQGLSVREVGSTGLQIGTAPQGASVTFAPTAGGAQLDQIQGRVPGAEVIGSALVEPNHASDSDLKKIEDCVAQGVSG